MLRVPLLSGSRMPLVTVDDDALLLAPPARLDALLDIGAAVREALRYPLSGPRLADLVTPGGSAAVVVEPRSLPFPDAPGDPRRAALGAVSDELERLGMRAEQQTILIAGGLERRAGRHEREGVLTPTEARDFRGSVVVHDAADPDLQALELDGGGTVHIHGALLDADLIVVLTAAETSERGGACTLLDACAAEDIAQPAPAPSLLAPSLSPRGITAGRVAAALARRTAVTGVSILLDHPRPTGRYRGYPSAPGWSPPSRTPPCGASSTRCRGSFASTRSRAWDASSARPPSWRALRPSRTPRPFCGGSRCGASRSTARWTRSSCRCRGDRCTSRASR